MRTANKNKILLSGIAPSGTIHIGNYLAATKQLAEFQEKFRVFAMIADLHAVTTPQEPAALREKTLELAALLFAAGLDHKKSVVFIQSQIPAHAELMWILNTLTPLGELGRMTQFKEKRQKTGLLAGLLNYPVLQAADILLYQTDIVPVGEDQLQHIELARTLARKFNGKFGTVFKIPRAIVKEEADRIMGLDNPVKKMSKSAGPDNYIALLDSPKEIRRKIKSAVTDSGREIRYDEAEKPAISNLMKIYGAFSGLSCGEIEKRWHGKCYVEFKNALAELLIESLLPIQKTYREFAGDEKALRKILDEGAKKASAAAQKTLIKVKRKVGFLI